MTLKNGWEGALVRDGLHIQYRRTNQ